MNLGDLNEKITLLERVDISQLPTLARDLDRWLPLSCRTSLWAQYSAKLGFTSIPQSQQKHYFSTMIEAFLSDRMKFQVELDTFVNLVKKRAPELSFFLVVVPKLAQVAGNMIKDHEQKSKESALDPMELVNRNPDAHHEDVLPPQIASPFGSGAEATMAQIRCLQEWSETLDNLAYAHKTALWRICQSQGVLFGFSHQPKSFSQTIQVWSYTPEAHASSIRILFGAIGLLKNNGILTHDFFYPDQKGVLVPVFRGEKDPNRKKKLMRRKRRRGISDPTDDEPVQAGPINILASAQTPTPTLPSMQASLPIPPSKSPASLRSPLLPPASPLIAEAARLISQTSFSIQTRVPTYPMPSPSTIPPSNTPYIFNPLKRPLPLPHAEERAKKRPHVNPLSESSDIVQDSLYSLRNAVVGHDTEELAKLLLGLKGFASSAAPGLGSFSASPENEIEEAMDLEEEDDLEALLPKSNARQLPVKGK